MPVLRILLIEDQRDIAANIWDYLEQRTFVMDHACDGVSGLRMALENSYDVIILDLGLPKLDGISLCRQLKAQGNDVPIIMLTARDTLQDKLCGFLTGADDYMTKPFALSELEARLRALSRRGQIADNGTLHCLDLQLDLTTYQVMRSGVVINLPRSSISLLVLMMQHSPNVVRHQQLAHELWGEERFDMGILHAHISVLRAAIDKPFDRPLLHTVHGFGYKLAI